MINTFTYDEQYFRTIPACIIDGRKDNPNVYGQTGDVIKAFTDAEVAKASKPDVLKYKMETENGNLVGALTLKVENGSANLYQLWLREAFKVNISEITQDISIFITSLTWAYDALL